MDSQFYGQIILFAGNFDPRGWMECDGQLLAISRNEPLFAILGTQYGGDGRTTFALPKIEKKNGCRYLIAVAGFFPSRT